MRRRFARVGCPPYAAGLGSRPGYLREPPAQPARGRCSGEYESDGLDAIAANIRTRPDVAGDIRLVKNPFAPRRSGWDSGFCLLTLGPRVTARATRAQCPATDPLLAKSPCWQAGPDRIPQGFDWDGRLDARPTSDQVQGGWRVGHDVEVADVLRRCLVPISPAPRTLASMHGTGLVNLYTRDIEASIRFYEDLLGFSETFRTPKEGIPEHVEFELGGFKVGLGTVEAARRVHGVEPAPGSPAMVLVVWTDDVNRAFDELVAAGVPVVQPPHDTSNNNRNALLSDPDGNLVEIVAKVPRQRVGSSKVDPTGEPGNSSSGEQFV